MPTIGDPKRFACTFELDENPCGAWLFGRICFWIGGTQVGDYELGTTLRDVLTEIDGGRRDWAKRQSTRFIGLPAEEIFRTLAPVLDIGVREIVDEVALDEVWVRFRFLPNLDVFDEWEAFVVEGEGISRVIFSQEPYEEVRDQELAFGECDGILRETWTALLDIWDAHSLEAGTDEVKRND